MNPTSIDFQPRRDVAQLGAVLASLGALMFLGGLLFVPAATWANFLLVSYYLLTLGLGGLVFVAFLYVCGAGWGVALRRLPEALAFLIPVGCVGVALVLVCYPSLYPWHGHSVAGAHGDSPFRRFWLSRPFFLFRALGYFAVWTLFALGIVRFSQRQDADGKVGLTTANVRLSAAFLVAFALTCWLSSVDWIMSLEPGWSSTIFGVYHFSGLFLAALAMVAVLAVYLDQQGVLEGVISTGHLHDLGKLLFAFSSFWMYIWFSQYMLIWYVNNPEETSYFVRRLDGGWRVFFYLNVLLNWVVPFLALLPKATKTNPMTLLAVALAVLVGRWVDLYLMILPPVGRGPLHAFGLVEAGLVAGGVGVLLLVAPRALARASLVPVGDPFLVESLPHPEHHGDHAESARALA